MIIELSCVIIVNMYMVMKQIFVDFHVTINITLKRRPQCVHYLQQRNSSYSYCIIFMIYSYPYIEKKCIQ